MINMFNLGAIPRRQAMILLGVVVLLTAGWLLWHEINDHQATKEKLQQAIVLSQQQVRDINVLQNQLKLSKQNATMFAEFVNKAQTGAVKPVAKFTQSAPTVEKAAEKVAKRITAKDSTLPPVALESTDNTVVTTLPLTDKEKQEVDKQNAANKDTGQPPIDNKYKVGVFKNNNYRNWDISAGIGYHKEWYVPIEAQRNYSKDHAVSAEIHIGEKARVTGGEVKYSVKTDKLFGLF